jgi:hypothetical protein
MNGYMLTGLSRVIAPSDAPPFVTHNGHSAERYAPVRAHVYKVAAESVGRLTAGDLLTLARSRSG